MSTATIQFAGLFWHALELSIHFPDGQTLQELFDVSKIEGAGQQEVILSTRGAKGSAGD
jgi:hypothetical protein